MRIRRSKGEGIQSHYPKVFETEREFQEFLNPFRLEEQALKIHDLKDLEIVEKILRELNIPIEFFYNGNFFDEKRSTGIRVTLESLKDVCHLFLKLRRSPCPPSVVYFGGPILLDAEEKKFVLYQEIYLVSRGLIIPDTFDPDGLQFPLPPLIYTTGGCSISVFPSGSGVMSGTLWSTSLS